MERVYADLLTEAPGLDMTAIRRVQIPLNIESSTLTTPSVVKLGAFKGFSLPIWSTGATISEELYVKAKVPDQWDGKSAATLRLSVALSGTEATPNAFQFNFAWQKHSTLATSTVVSADSGDVDIVAGSLATYSIYEATMSLAYSSLSAGEYIAGRIRRKAADGTDITNEIIVLGGVIEFQVNRIFGKIGE